MKQLPGKISARRLIWMILLLIGLGVIDRSIATLQIDQWWFSSIGYLQNWQRQIQTKTWLAILGSTLSGLWLVANYIYSKRWQAESPILSLRIPLTASPLADKQPPPSRLIILLILSIATGIITTTATLYPLWATWPLPKMLWLWPTVMVGCSIATILRPLPVIAPLIITTSIGWGYFWANHWQQVLPAFAATPFQQREPVFDRDISFYIFQLPLQELADQFALSLSLGALAIATLIYLCPHISDGWIGKLPLHQHRHLAFLAGTVAWSIAHHFSLARYQLLYSQRGVVYGAGYADLWGYLPIYNLLLAVNCIIGISCWLWASGIWRLTAKLAGFWRIPRRFWLPIVGIVLLIISLPLLIQWGVVSPNELAIEKTYIQRNIAFTRQAFALDKIDIQTFDPSGNLTAQDIANNQATIKNIRLWDARPLLQSNRQLQQIRPYYKFVNADIDRYLIKNDLQQVILSAREIDGQSLTEKAQTWINRHLVYTHGYGYTVSPVNRAAAGGLPDYLVKDIGNSKLPIPDPAISVTEPRIYYGEITDDYIFAPSIVPELDYPSGSDNTYNSYTGQGGITMDGWWRRWIGARYLQDWEVLFTKNFIPKTQLLLHRSVVDRVHKLVPWLLLDQDPYLAIAKSTQTKTNRLYWILDGYTTSNHYPYADPGKGQFNYIRNSVKISINAYDGSTQFYVSDQQDPILQTWCKILPDMWQPLKNMPISLRSHLRYPTDLFHIQSDRLRTYHMQDPQVFYNREDLWQIPQEIYGGKSQAVQPYYVITKLPTASDEEFLLLSPFTPSQRTNLIAWLAARSDGEQYGKLLLYQFPKQQLVYGTEQIESLIDQDPAISQQIGLWNRQGMSAVKGNLLVIPITSGASGAIERSLLYVEPLYLEAQQNSLPTLGRVIVVYRDRISMAETLNQALQNIFPTDSKS
jgi:uncharacterized protein